MLTYQNRRDRLIELLKEISAVELFRRTGIAPSTISRYQLEPGAPSHKNISEKNARRIEGAAGKTDYWLDKPAHRGASSSAPQAGDPQAGAIAGLSAQARVLGAALDAIPDPMLRALAYQHCLQTCAAPKVLTYGAPPLPPAQPAPQLARPLHRPQ